MIADRPFNITYYSKPSTLQPSNESRVPYTYPIVIAYSRRSVASTMLRYSTILVLGCSTGIRVGLPVIVLRLLVPVLVVPVLVVSVLVVLPPRRRPRAAKTSPPTTSHRIRTVSPQHSPGGTLKSPTRWSRRCAPRPHALDTIITRVLIVAPRAGLINHSDLLLSYRGSRNS